MKFMGVFDFVKKIFKPEPEVIEEISLENIDDWFSKKYSSKQDFLNGQIAGIKANIHQAKDTIRQNIEGLKKAELRNKNVPEKAKHFMEGNRTIYIQKTEQFLESISVPEDAENIKQFLSDFDKRLDVFGKSTIRSYSILREFFEEEVSKIANNIKKIDKSISEIKEALKDSKLKELDDVKHSIAKLKNKINQKAFLEGEISKKKSHAEDLKKEKDKTMKQISQMETSTTYKDYQMIKHRHAEAKKESSEKEEEITHLFSSLERPMKKYLRVIYNDKNLLEKYATNPVEALTQDFSLKIIAILSNMKKAVLDDSLELKDKQKVKALEDIKKLDKDSLSRILSGYAQLKKKDSGLAAELESFTIVEDMEKSKEKLSITSAMLDKAKKDIENLNSDLSKINIPQLKENLKEKIKSVLGITAVIS